MSSKDRELNEEDCVCKRQSAPNLATVKEFILYYIFFIEGMLALQLIMLSVLNFTERFFASFTRVAKTVFIKADTDKVYFVSSSI